MYIRFPDIDEGFIKSQVENGFYTNETEVVRDAVRRLREEKQARHNRLYKAALKGDAAIERGETVPYSRALMEEMKAEVIERAHQGKSGKNPDVIPSDFQP